MILKQLKPRKALNKAYLKLKPDREKIDLFKANLIQLLDRIDDSESEEFHKNLISDFLKNTYYKDDYFINTKERADLVIHNGKNRASTVGVIIETKRPTNKWEIITPGEINAKAFHELLLYYLRERITNGNLEVRNLIVTNIHEWFIFDSAVFERNFAQNKALVRQFEEFERSKQRTEVFYSDIAHPFIESLRSEIEFTYFDIRDYNHPLRNDNPDDDNKLIALYKLLSAEHLLKLPFANDSNTLDKSFYGELLHIMGLSESKEGGKKVIGREQEGKRNIGSLIENAINELDSLDKMSRLDRPSQYGGTMQERLFTVALELTITWMNRILFMKLLEAQLVKYHKGNTQYEFLNSHKIQNYDDLNSLFFKVLARKQSDRGETTKEAFDKVPYLNSSLFEPTELEHTTLFVSNLGDSRELPVYASTVLKDSNGKRRTGRMNPLEYLFEFLDSYDFTSEGSEAIQEDNKTLINASVLGLIFEKINGYKDGSFFTPGFITMYMCRETIRKAVLQKFNETKGWKCTNFDDLYDEIEDRKEANDIINSLKICDPAVGSGHFLVSALNEIIAIKNDLRILSDRSGRRLKEYHVVVENDELIVTDEEGVIIEYTPTSRESQRVQEALFHEKQTIIENCLFGVDINPNSVKICRLRLWIELLKNAYYIKPESVKLSSPVCFAESDEVRNDFKLPHVDELQTLPNIDINIKCGNSLVSRFDLDANLGQALKKSKWTIDSYRMAVSTYRNAHSKEEKRGMERLIMSIKNDFRSEIAGNDPKVKRLAKIKGELLFLTTQTSLFEQSKKEKKEWTDKVEKHTTEITKLENEIEEIKANKIYENAFEWRFEFPEVLNDEGDFVGFDVVIGNPPYVQLQKMGEVSDDLGRMGFNTFAKTGDIYSLFYELGYNVLKQSGVLTYITSNKWMRAGYGKNTREFFVEKTNPVILIDFGGTQIFESATVDTNILMFVKEENKYKTSVCIVKDEGIKDLEHYIHEYANITEFKDSESWIILSPIESQIKEKIERLGTPLKEMNFNINYGIKTGLNEAFVIDENKKNELIAEDFKSNEIIRPVLRGRDVKRYYLKFANLWLINTHNGVKEKGLKPININDYPAIKKHLDKFYPQLKRRGDKGETPYNLRNCAYLHEFNKQKIIFQEMVQESSFVMDKDGKFMCLDTARIITGDGLELLLAVMNSKLFFYSIKTFYGGGGLGNTGVRMKHTFFENFPMPKFTEEQILKLQEYIKHPDESSHFIDKIIYSTFDLNSEEIEEIEESVK